MAFLGSTVLNVALPAIKADLGAILAAYALVVPEAARMGSRARSA